METIIQQITLELGRKITKKALSGGLNDIDAFSHDIFTDCKEASVLMIETICKELNLKIRQDKEARKSLGLTLKEKDRKRELLTELGRIEIARDYYQDKKNNRYVYPLDHAVGIRKYERVGDIISARMVSLATEMSYAKSAAIGSDNKLSRQTVKNHIKKLKPLEKKVESEEQKRIKELHIYADEDHAHMQRPGKKKGKRSKIVPLVTVTEGIRKESKGRNRTIASMHFVDENFDTNRLWKSVQGYIEKEYDIGAIDNIYIHADGGKWIKNGLEDLSMVVRVMDGYHVEKRIRSVACKFPKKNVATRIKTAIRANDRKRADEILQSLYDVCEDEKQTKSVEEFGRYLMGNWKEIVSRKTLDIPGSCTEAQVSHVLSERFSRNPIGWSEEGLGKLSKLRVYMKNGGRITADEFKPGSDDKESYSDYARRVRDEAVAERMDWSIFDKEPPILNGASATQSLIQGMGSLKNTFWS